ncbi:calcium-binding protein [Fimbriimonas ginsengisoli]|uniref:Hemolysin-type calcium-binding region n=1 Tax=Fimbriimonas ginsengisoli Gsoil 348 TaxID=661478 RepID=A0A068NRE4_FIMGI|nr:calcium-binding protein [Fimbriimonas ginsengisoli]AIE86083.1 Hemolysin-type calcium-binding region [Fimbriimonas ginsengisoli Gsoil 348]
MASIGRGVWAGFVVATLVAGCSRPPRVSEVTGCIANGETASFPIEGPATGESRSAFDGFGCNSVATRGELRCVHLRPKAATNPKETHAGLFLGPYVHGDMTVSCGILTAAQLRLGSPSNPHEVGWLIWNYRDNDHFYYAMAKPNGWELGKRDPAFPGGQRFLATDDRTTYPVGRRYELRVEQRGNRIELFIDGQSITVFEDTDHPYTGGIVGFYTEDADVYFDSLKIGK